MRRQLHALCFAAAQRGSRLPKPQIAQADIGQHFETGREPGCIRKERKRLSHRKLKHFVNAQSLVFDVENGLLIARSLALFAD